VSSAPRILGAIVVAALTGVLAGVLAACGTPSRNAHPAAASTTASPVWVQPDVVGWSGMAQRPQAIYVGMGGAPVARGLNWRHWGSPAAWATGRLDIYWPQAGPISGWHPTAYPVTVRLQSIHRHNGQPSYRQMTYSYVNRRGMPKSLRFTFAVQPGGSLPSWNQQGQKRPDDSAGGSGQTETRSHTKMRVSPGAITFPAPRSP
jgi:hypothetical protein